MCREMLRYTVWKVKSDFAHPDLYQKIAPVSFILRGMSRILAPSTQKLVFSFPLHVDLCGRSEVLMEVIWRAFGHLCGPLCTLLVVESVLSHFSFLVVRWS